MKPFAIPIAVVGPGSQPEGESLDYLELPHDMQTYRPPVLPEPDQLAGQDGVRRVLAGLAEALRQRAPGERVAVDLSGLDAAGLELLGQILGEGEVSARVDRGMAAVRVQESVFAGVWRVRTEVAGAIVSDAIELADIPAVLCAGDVGATVIERPEAGPEVANGPALLAEIEEHARLGTPHHVVNLTLLPFTPGDGDYLDRALGRGPAVILSRGYGNCRITSTAVPGVWWVQYFNAQDALILNTVEIVDLPDAARAAEEDLADSRERLLEVLAWLAEA